MNRLNARKELIRIAIAALLLAACLLLPGRAEQPPAEQSSKAGVAMLIESIQHSVMDQANESEK